MSDKNDIVVEIVSYIESHLQEKSILTIFHRI